MRTAGYLVISNKGAMRIAKRKPRTTANEVAVHLRIEVPDRYFDQQWPVVNVNLPEPDPTEVTVNIEGQSDAAD